MLLFSLTFFVLHVESGPLREGGWDGKCHSMTQEIPSGSQTDIKYLIPVLEIVS